MPVSLEIVSPDRLLLSRPVDMVVIPASEGDMGVLEGHQPMIVMLRGGVVSLYEGDRVTDTLFVAGGFAEVTPERCTVLAAEVDPAYGAGGGWALDRQQSAGGWFEAGAGLLTGRGWARRFLYGRSRRSRAPA